MKSTPLLLAALFAGAAYAGEFTSFQRVQFQAASTFVPGEKVCQHGGMLYHKSKDTITVSYCDDNGANCKTAVKPLVQPIKSTRERCVEYSGSGNENCVRSKIVPFVQGPEIKVKTYESYNDMIDNHNPVGEGRYRLPDCADVREI